MELVYSFSSDSCRVKKKDRFRETNLQQTIMMEKCLIKFCTYFCSFMGWMHKRKDVVLVSFTLLQGKCIYWLDKDRMVVIKVVMDGDIMS